MENMDFLPPTAPSLVIERETYTPYIFNLLFHQIHNSLLVVLYIKQKPVEVPPLWRFERLHWPV